MKRKNRPGKTAEKALREALAENPSDDKEIHISYDINGFVVDIIQGKGRGLCMPYDGIPGGKFICLVLGREMTERQGLEFAKQCIETGEFGFFPGSERLVKEGGYNGVL